MLNKLTSYETVPQEAAQINRALLDELGERVGRKDFLSALAEVLYPICGFSWLVLRMREHRDEMVADYSNPDKKHINPFAPVLPRSLTSTVADYIHDTRESLVIPDCVEYFIDMAMPPIFQHSMASVIAFPLSLNNEIFASLHLGFEAKPDNLYKVASFASHICPTVSACLGVVLSHEHMRVGRLTPEPEARDHLPPEMDFDAAVVFHSQAMREVARQLNVLAGLDVPVLLLGETGTGKSMIARHIHEHSLRASGRFVRVNCPSLVSSLFESEMFGHAKGSFTGATKNRMGRFELAHKGTLFLDEVAELSLDMQSKLLQVLDDSSFERVGESVPINVDMRIVAATNVHIGEAISQGRLRGDLFHRISVYTIDLPPLRERPEDIEALARVFSGQAAARMGLPDINYGQSTMPVLKEYYWPGNTRELSNLITRLVIVQNVHGELNASLVKSVIEQSENYFLAESESSNEPGDGRRMSAALAPAAVDEGKMISLAELEREHILKVLEYAGGVIAGARGAAKILGLPRSTLLHRMKKLGIKGSVRSREYANN